MNQSINNYRRGKTINSNAQRDRSGATPSDDGDAAHAPENGRRASFARAGERTTLAGFAIYAVFAAHSIAGAWIGLSFALLGWLVRTAATRTTGIRRTALDLPLWLFFAWTALSALFSAEPRTSLLKLISVSTFLIFYLAQAALTRRTATLLAGLMIVSGVAGVVWSAGEVAIGRGIVVEQIAADSPFRDSTLLQMGDAIWRVGSGRVSSVAGIDEAMRRAATGQSVPLSVVSRGEHVEWVGPVVTDEMKARPSPSGITGTRPTRRFRASGWTRHYETFAEMLQMLAQLALGFALANLQRRPPVRLHVFLPAAAFVVLAAGIALTAMRTVLVAFAVGAGVIAWRAATRGRARVAVSLVLVMVLAFGALAVWRTRAAGALLFQDASASLRWQVVSVALERITLHPVTGHGMDAVHRHWQEWGFPGTDMLHAHSTPVQIAFDRGLPALLLWLWLVLAFWLAVTRAEKTWRDSDDAATHGLLLGTTGALAGFFASSLVNYNFGDAEAAILFWWLMGATTRISRT